MIARIRAALAAWWERNIVANDPNPEYSRLDRLDGLDAVGKESGTVTLTLEDWATVWAALKFAANRGDADRAVKNEAIAASVMAQATR